MIKVTPEYSILQLVIHRLDYGTQYSNTKYLFETNLSHLLDTAIYPSFARFITWLSYRFEFRMTDSVWLHPKCVNGSNFWTLHQHIDILLNALGHTKTVLRPDTSSSVLGFVISLRVEHQQHQLIVSDIFSHFKSKYSRLVAAVCICII